MDAIEIKCNKDMYVYYGNFDWIMYIKKNQHLKNFENINQIYKYIIEEETKKNDLIYFDLNNNLIKKGNVYTYNDLNVSKEDFQWIAYLIINYKLKIKGIDNVEKAWNHWINYGKKEEIAFSLINNTNIHCGRTGNLFFLNMYLHLMSIKYNLKCSYKKNDLFHLYGLKFNKGEKMYNKNLLVTEQNALNVLNGKYEPSNLIFHNNISLQSRKFCSIIKEYINANENIKNNIIKNNIFKNRYNNNNDLFIHIRLGDVSDRFSNIDIVNYYEDILDDEKDKCANAFISSDSIEHEICKNLINKYKLIAINYNEIETIMFANTCNKIILSGGTFSWMIGFFAFYAKVIYYPIFNKNITKKWYGEEIFTFSNWIGIYIEKNEFTQEYQIFDWITYTQNYKDLQNINNKEVAWNHWINYGKKEKRVTYNLNKKEKENFKSLFNKENVMFFEIENLNSNLIIKNNYNHYGTHYFGWKGCINNFINYFTKNKYHEKIQTKNKIFLDEWLEKLLIWGNKIENNIYLKKIKCDNCKLVTFIHNPPAIHLEKYNNEEENLIMYNKDFLNNHLFSLLNKNNIEDKIEYIYTLSNSHKEYIHTNYPLYKTKILSVYHPIDFNDSDKHFNYELFIKTKKIVHIGWWLRNFKTFIDLKIHKDIKIKKCILVKSDFKKEWEEKSSNFCLDNIEIIEELQNDEYVKTFENSVIFIDMEDSVANNVILECIRFNTPIFTKKLPSSVEYLGEEYPLFFTKKEEIEILFQNKNLFFEKIQKANQYLVSMNKNHVQLQRFNTKIIYDLNKLSIKNDNKLSWFCFIDKEEYVSYEIIDYIVKNFKNQDNYMCLKLIFVLHKSIIINDFNCLLEKYIDLLNIYSIENKEVDKYTDFLNCCIANTNTDFLTIINIKDTHHKFFSNYMIEYLVNTKTCDIAYSSYTFKNNEQKLFDVFNYKKDTLLFISKLDNISFKFTDTGVCWRKEIHSVVGNFENDFDFELFWKKCIDKNLNIFCASDVILYNKCI